MTNFEKLLPFLTAALVILTAVIGVLCARVERRLAARKKIRLSTYKEQSNLFYILNDVPTAVIAGGAAVLSLALLILSLINPVIRIYSIVLALLLPVDGAVSYLSMTRRRCQRDIRVFDTYYVQVDHVLARKDRILSDIRVCKMRVDDLRGRLSDTIHEFNQNLVKGVPTDFLPALFAPIDTMIASYMEEIDRFSAEVEKNFDDAMQEFLQNEVVPEFSMVPLRTFDESAVDDLLGTIKSSYADKITDIVIDQVDHGALKNARALGNIMSLFHRLQVGMDKETLKRFLVAAARFNDREALAALLYTNRQISIDTVREVFVPENWEWIFVPEMAKAFNRRELGFIFADILDANRPNMCYRLMIHLDTADLDVLELAIAEARERLDGDSNEALKMASACAMILQSAYAVGGSGNLLENIAYMLYDRRSELNLPTQVQERIAEIVRTESFCAAEKELTELYSRVAKGGKALVASTTRILLQYIISDPEGFLDPRRFAELLAEYRVTLSFADIRTMRALLCAWMMIHVKDSAVTDLIASELKALPALPTTEKGSVESARDILSYLTEKDRVRLRSVIYRTESARQMLDTVLQL